MPNVEEKPHRKSGLMDALEAHQPSAVPKKPALPKFGRVRDETDLSTPADVIQSDGGQLPTLGVAVDSESNGVENPQDSGAAEEKQNNKTNNTALEVEGLSNNESKSASAVPGELPTLGVHVLEIDLDQLVESDANPRQGYHPQDVEGLALSMAREGQKVPILITRHQEKWMIVEGETRVRAARTLGWVQIRAIETQAHSRGERYIAGRTANSNRTSLTDFDDGVAWGLLIKDGVFASYADLSRKLGIDMPRSELSRMKSYADLPGECIEAMRPHKRKFTSALATMVRQVQEHAGVRRAMSFINEIATKDLSVRQAEARKRDICGEERDGSRQKSRIHRVVVGDREVGRVFVKPNGRIEIAVAGVDDDETARLGSLVASMLSENVKGEHDAQ